MLNLHSLFTDHAVLQRDKVIPVWGTTQPRAQVTVCLGGSRAVAQADAQGAFCARLAPLAAGGPFVLDVQSGTDRVQIQDILIGEVWICSGQSNMEWPTENGGFPEAEIEAATYPTLRLFKVPRVVALTPQRDVNASWETCTPEHIRPFSAVGFAFARDLMRRLKVPVGLIGSSWGGTLAEAWTPRAVLLADDKLKGLCSKWDAVPKAELNTPEYDRLVKQWDSIAYHVDPGNEGEKNGWHQVDHDVSAWKIMVLPCYFEQYGLNIDGSVWFRTTVTIPADWVGKSVVLNLGPIDDFDTTYVNGVKIGGIGAETPNAFNVPRRYMVDAAVITSAVLTVAVRVFDRFGNGGICGKRDQLYVQLAADDSLRVDLVGDWLYNVELALEPKVSLPPLPPSSTDARSPGGLYNAMIAPLQPFANRGVIWYQGESNADRGVQYQTLLPALIDSWRHGFETSLSFYIVQLCAYKQPVAQPGECMWAELREAQALVADRVPGCGVAITIDSGEPDDIHPWNKALVGHRLARLALRRDYGCEDVVDEGPVAISWHQEGDASMRIGFRVQGGLIAAGSGEARGFAVAGTDRLWHSATAVVRCDDVVVKHPNGQPVAAVRYAWADNPDATLYDASGLPARPFRTDDWPLLSSTSV